MTHHDRSCIMVNMNRLNTPKRTAVVGALCEGNSIRATVRMTGVAKNTIVKLLVDLGAVVTRYQDETLRNLPCKRLQCDEIWAFVGGKDKMPVRREAGSRSGLRLDVDVHRCGHEVDPIVACW